VCGTLSAFLPLSSAFLIALKSVICGQYMYAGVNTRFQLLACPWLDSNRGPVARGKSNSPRSSTVFVASDVAV
jgi:hypothetical protein